MIKYTKKAFSDDINSEIRGFVFKSLRNIVINTPVDTGRARGNWQVGVDSIKTSVLNASDRSGNTSIAKGANQLSAANNFQAIYITNNLDYIGDLNEGTSQQAPSKFVESGIVRALND